MIYSAVYIADSTDQMSAAFHCLYGRAGFERERVPFGLTEYGKSVFPIGTYLGA